MVEWLFLAGPWGGLRFLIVVFPDHTHLIFLIGTHVSLYHLLGTLIQYAWTDLIYWRGLISALFQTNKAIKAESE